MKFLFLSALLMISNILYSTAQDLAKAFAKGDAETISFFLANNVEICLKNEVNLYTKSSAKNKLSQFFSENTPKAYQEIHQGNSKGNSSYTIGLLSTQNGTYRIYLYFTRMNDDIKINEIRLEEEK